MLTSVVFSPDGKILATAGADGDARLWDVATRQAVGPSLATGVTGTTAAGSARTGRSSRPPAPEAKLTFGTPQLKASLLSRVIKIAVVQQWLQPMVRVGEGPEYLRRTRPVKQPRQRGCVESQLAVMERL